VLLDRRKVNKAYLLNGSMPLATVSKAAEIGKDKSTELSGLSIEPLRALKRASNGSIWQLHFSSLYRRIPPPRLRKPT
jgi:hypothetical protein